MWKARKDFNAQMDKKLSLYKLQTVFSSGFLAFLYFYIQQYLVAGCKYVENMTNVFSVFLIQLITNPSVNSYMYMCL
jgi:prepilin signal peptidase PulO-like enzyme (type II secretory pathway)